ncbi:hypothetical protein RQP46_009158 [Phenoliferia psychrophenolica]
MTSDYKSTISESPKMEDKELGKSSVKEVGEVNASGHHDQMERQYGLLATCATALAIDNAWIALGGSIVVSIYNGGAPGVLYELLTACFWYSLIAASLAEMASSIPSSGGVYHYATVTAGPKWGLVAGYFTGLLSWGGWIMNSCAIAQIPSNVLVQLWALHHPDYVSESWHVYVCYIIVTWSTAGICIFGNRLIPTLQHIGLFLVTAGLVVTVAVLAALPKTHATSSFVWKDFENQTGYESNGVAFLTGVLNGAFVIGTPDSITHMAEELPNPRKQLPIAIAAQIVLGTLSSFVFGIALMYGISDLEAILSSVANFPLAVVYSQATNANVAATTGLLVIVLLAIYITMIGCHVTCGRSWFALSRDGATPFSKVFGRASTKLSCPVESTVFCAFVITCLGAIQLGSTTAFTDLVGSFILLTTVSYAIPTVAHVFSGRTRLPIGYFWMGRMGFVINIASVLLTAFFFVMFCFPYSLPVTTELMNYTSVIFVGYTVLVSGWWIVIRRRYVGPKIPHLEEAGRLVIEAI